MTVMVILMVHLVLAAAMWICQISLAAVLVALEISLIPSLVAAMVAEALLNALVVVTWVSGCPLRWKKPQPELLKLSRITDFLPAMTVTALVLVRAERLKTVHVVTARARWFRFKILSLVRCSLRQFVQSAKEQARRLSMPVRPVEVREELLITSVFL